MTTLILVPGTWGGQPGDWTSKGSPFQTFVESKDFACLSFQGWTGDLCGVPIIGENGSHSDWIAGGFSLAYFLKSIPYFDRNVIAHSHGGQVVAYCCERTGTDIRRLLTVATPVRKDMFPIYKEAAKHIGYWEHARSSGWDLMQRLGEALDGHIGWLRNMPDANQNIVIPGMGHSKLLHDSKFIPMLESAGLLEPLRAPVVRII